jgi:hypothetical protein
MIARVSVGYAAATQVHMYGGCLAAGLGRRGSLFCTKRGKNLSTGVKTPKKKVAK